jgi:DNA-binding MarR family transcriptional regulator
MEKENLQNREQAVRLALALKHVLSRLHTKMDADFPGLNMTQVAVLRHLDADGPATTSTLAALEHITQQAVSQIIPQLKEAGLLVAATDPNDGRKTIFSITSAGRQLRQTLRASREEWLAQAIAANLNDTERVVLDQAIELLERLANSKQ